MFLLLKKAARPVVCLLSILFFSILSLSHAQLSNSDRQTITDALDQYQQVAVRVEFDDPAVGRDVARGFEPFQTSIDQGYVILVLDGEGFTTLNAAANTLPIRLSYDVATMARYIIPGPQSEVSQRLQTLRTFQNLSLDGAVTSNSFNGTQFASIPGFACYRTVEGTYETAEAIVNAFPNLASWTDIGDSWEKTAGLGGFDIQVLSLTNSATTGVKPALTITGGIHAREYTPVELLTRFAEHLVTSYNTDADVTWVLDNHIVNLIFIANPDGRKRAETGLLWRKNVNENYCGATSNSRGADLNRNFQFAFGCCGGSSSNQCSETYRGPFAASEPETQAVQNFLLNNYVDNRLPDLNAAAPDTTQGMYIDVHSSGGLVLWPWGFTPNATPNGVAMQTLGRKLAFPTGYSPEQAAASFTTDGETDSFGYGELGLPSYTFELGTTFFEPCTNFENTILPDNLETLMYAARALRTPYITPAGPDSVNVSLEFASAVPAGTPVGLSALADDTRFNNSNGTEPTQAISAAEYYIDVPPWQASATPIAMTAADGLFNSNAESIVGNIDTTFLSAGRHTIFVRAQDANGIWGAFSAVFLDIDNTASVPVTLFEDDFETDQGWTTNAQGSDTATTGQWERGNPEQVVLQGAISQLGTSNSGVNNLVTGALAGAGAGTFDIDNGVTSVRSPDIAIPANAQSVNLSLAQYFYHFSNSNADDFLTISIVGTSTSVVLDERGAGTVRPAQWAPLNVDISSFAGQTIHILIEAADAGGGSLVEAGIDDVVISAIIPASTNQAPSADAGANQSVTLPDNVSLNGNASDDGLPSNSLSSAWSVISGPGTVNFANANNALTTASFSSAGVYVLRLTVDDGDLNDSDDVTITVNPEPPANEAPSVSAGADQAITLPDNAILSGNASDDGLPSNALTVGWSQVSGPGVASFASANSTSTLVSFSSQGAYVLRLTASDGDLTSSDDVTIVVNPAAPVNQAPNVDAGANVNVTLPNAANLAGSVNDDGLPSNTLTLAWTQVSGPGTTNFANPDSATTTASFSTAGTYVLRLTANDGALTDSDELTVTVNPQPPVNTAPSVNAGSNQTITLPAAANLSGTVSDDGLPSNALTTGWSVVTGPGSVNFADANATVTSASFTVEGVYVLRLTADDTALSSTDDITITVNAAPNSDNFETVTLSNVTSNWQLVNLANNYTNAVVVCTPQYANTNAPAVTRVRNIGGSSFELRVQNPSDSAISVLSVSCLVMEQGRWALPDGRLIEAQSYNSTRTDNRTSWVGDAQSYLNSYTNPVVLGQVMSANDADWSSFWSRGSSRGAVPSSSVLFAGKNVAEDNDTTRADETVGFIVVQAGTGSIGGSDYRAALGADTIQGSTNPVRSYNFAGAFASTPAFAIASQSAMDGNNGGWAYLRGAGALSASSITLAIDEDQVRDSERAHTTEQVAYFVIENQVSVTLTPIP